MKVDRGGFNRSLEMGGMRIWGSRIVALLYAIKLNESFTRWSWREGGSYIKPWQRVCTSNTSGIHMSGSLSACSYARSWLARGERIHGQINDRPGSNAPIRRSLDVASEIAIAFLATTCPRPKLLHHGNSRRGRGSKTQANSELSTVAGPPPLEL